jgi:hypothetical protein
LRDSGSTISPAEAVSAAIKLWIDKQRADREPGRGYQWKQLFLPETTSVRMYWGGLWYGADIVGDELVYRGNSVSPNQMVQQVAGEGRNAWRELWLRFPGEKGWTNADRLRGKRNKQAAATPLSPAEAMVTAAKAMSEALTTAMMLVEHANHQAQNTLERRLPRYRRAHDLMEDIH